MEPTLFFLSPRLKPYRTSSFPIKKVLKDCQHCAGHSYLRSSSSTWHCPACNLTLHSPFLYYTPKFWRYHFISRLLRTVAYSSQFYSSITCVVLQEWWLPRMSCGKLRGSFPRPLSRSWLILGITRPLHILWFLCEQFFCTFGSRWCIRSFGIKCCTNWLPVYEKELCLRFSTYTLFHSKMSSVLLFICFANLHLQMHFLQICKKAYFL